MHVLQINKSLKESFNNSNSCLIQNDRSEIENIVKKHQEQIHSYLYQI